MVNQHGDIRTKYNDNWYHARGANLSCKKPGTNRDLQHASPNIEDVFKELDNIVDI